MSEKFLTLLYKAFENPSLQEKLNEADTAEKFVKVADEYGYQLTPDELGAGLGKMHSIFGTVVMSMMDKLTGGAAPPNGKAAAPSVEVSEKNIDLVKRLFSRGEAFDSEGFITFFTDTPVYQFGNFDVCLDKASIKQSADNFFSRISAVYHEIKAMWEEGDAVFVEMDVTYWRKDGSVISLPCFDIFRVEGDKFSELRIFMDVNPVFNPNIPVPNSASVFTASQGKKLMPPGTMKRHFAEHPEGKERVAKGFVPKWAIDGPKWPIESPATVTIDPASNVATVIVVFSIEPSEQQPLLDRIMKYGGGQVKHQPGFLSSSLHRSIDGKRVLNYTQWRSRQDYEAFMRNSQGTSPIERFGHIPDIHIYELVEQTVAPKS
ncbi:MAG TPA: nuclear transport factor 2 family protein [Leptolyngbyaceae cyanobacterium]